MPITSVLFASGWERPAFKVLANNDTKNAPGHQGGILIPKDIRFYFPDLAGRVTPLMPTLDQRVTAELFDETSMLGVVSTRYQYQTWGAERSPESRLTDQLSPLMYRAAGGDFIFFVRSLQNPDYYRLVLVRKLSPSFSNVQKRTGGRRWGLL